MSSPVTLNWLSIADLADLRLSGLPQSKFRINELAKADGWAMRKGENGEPLCRKRAGRGGGQEYHIDVLPNVARHELLLRRSRAEQAAPVPKSEAKPAQTNDAVRGAWEQFERLPAAKRESAEKRLAALRHYQRLVAIRYSHRVAVDMAAGASGFAASSLWRWLADLRSIPADDWLPFLAFHSGKGREEREIDDHAWQLLKSDYLRPEKPSWRECHRRIVDDYAAPRGIVLPDAGTLLRRLRREVPRDVEKAARSGMEAARKSLMPQRRSVADLHALFAVNIDGHTCDVFVNWGKDSNQCDIIERPTLIGIQDLYSRKILAHRIGETESTALTRMAFADLFRDFGIPEKCVMDNGRAFASKALTGGAKTRFRFRIKDTDPTGLLTSLDIDPHWAMPYRGSSKPIEKAWGDLCELIAKHPFCAGAYTGNKPDAKPENYASRAIPIDKFREFVASQVAKHNAREGRRTETAQGRSFDEVFAESYAVSPIRKASQMDLRKAFLEAEERKCHAETGAITLNGNTYHSDVLRDAMAPVRGKMVRVRFDPDNLHSSIFVYTRDDAFVAEVPVHEAVGFFDRESAKRRMRLEADYKRKTRAAVAAHKLVSADKLAELLADHDTPAPIAPPNVVRPVRHRRNAAALKPAQSPIEAPEDTDFIDSFAAGVRKHHLRVVD